MNVRAFNKGSGPMKHKGSEGSRDSMILGLETTVERGSPLCPSYITDAGKRKVKVRFQYRFRVVRPEARVKVGKSRVMGSCM